MDFAIRLLNLAFSLSLPNLIVVRLFYPAKAHVQLKYLLMWQQFYGQLPPLR